MLLKSKTLGNLSETLRGGGIRLLLESLILFLTVFMPVSWEYNSIRHFVSINNGCTRWAKISRAEANGSIQRSQFAL